MKKISQAAAGLVILAAAVLLGFGQTAQDHIMKGDEYYAAFDDQKALEEYLAAAGLEPSNYEALWKLSRAYTDVADVVPATEKDAKDKRLKLYTEGQNCARRAIAANPNETWGHFYLSAAMGKRVLLLGKKEQIGSSRTVKAEIEKAIQLDPMNDLAYHALGRWHRRIAEIGGAKRALGSIFYGSIPKGSFEESEKALLKAVELKPEYVNHRLELGRTYLALKKFDLAAAELQKCLDLPKTTSKDDLFKEEARAEMEKAKAKKS